MTTPAPLYGVVDGFTFNSRILNVMSYFQNVLAQMEPLRRANGYRNRMWVVPADSEQVPIPAFESVEYQIQCQPGSYLWGFNFWAAPQAEREGGANSEPVNAIRIVDACTQLPLSSSPGSSLAYAGTLVGSNKQALGLGQNQSQVLLPQPYLVNAPGLVNVEVTNGGNFTCTCQLLLMFAEPCMNQRELEMLIKRLR